MKFAYTIKHKLKFATLLFGVVICSVLIRFLEDKSVKDLNVSVLSMFNDRLVPSMYLFKLMENVYEKKTVVDQLFQNNGELGADAAKGRLRDFNVSIDSLIGRYEKTFLVAKEKEQLGLLKRKLSAAVTLENEIIAAVIRQDFAVARALYMNSAGKMTGTIITDLSAMMRTQEQVGKDLIEDTESIVSGSRLYSAMQISLAIVIGLLIIGIISASKTDRLVNDNFNLN